MAGSSIHVKKFEGESGKSELPGEGDLKREGTAEMCPQHFGGIPGCFCITILPLKSDKLNQCKETPIL